MEWLAKTYDEMAERIERTGEFLPDTRYSDKIEFGSPAGQAQVLRAKAAKIRATEPK